MRTTYNELVSIKIKHVCDEKKTNLNIVRQTQKHNLTRYNTSPRGVTVSFDGTS